MCFGFLTNCLLLVVEDFPEKNGGAPLKGVIHTLGEDAVIVARILSKWKVPTSLVASALGNDIYGETVTEQLRASGLEYGQTVKPGFVTPLAVGVVDTSGSRTYFQLRSPTALSTLLSPTVEQMRGRECCMWTGTMAPPSWRPWSEPVR